MKKEQIAVEEMLTYSQPRNRTDSLVVRVEMQTTRVLNRFVNDGVLKNAKVI